MSVTSTGLERFQMLIGGEWRDAADGRTFQSFSPCTGQPWAELPRAGAADVDAAVEAAHAAFTSGPWAAMLPSQRGLLLHRMGDIIAANAEQLARLEVQDNGKLMVEMLTQMRYLPHWFYYYGGLADKVEGAVTPFDRPGMLHYVQYEPLGVVAAITPWNSPLALTVWKLAPALAAGNTVVIKPSEHASASMLALVKLFEQGGFPPGVVNVVTGMGDEAGKHLVKHPLVAKVAFTGGESGGRAIATAAAANFKRLSLELGGKSPHIVFADADIDAAVKGVIAGIFAAAGQTCMAGSRLFLERPIHDRFVAKLVERVSQARIGDPQHDGTEIGPIATEAQLNRVLNYIELARSEGATCVLGGKRAEVPELPGGWFVEPTIFTGVTNDMRIAQEEVFGPILSVIPFDSEAEVIAMANATPYGLAAGFWTESIDRAINLPRKIRAGSVWVNTYRVVSFMAPFGGFKHSGVGRENGIDAIYEYLEAKSVVINGVPRINNPFTLQ